MPRLSALTLAAISSEPESESTVDLIGQVIGALLNAVIVGFLARRLLGVPVGWPRTVIVSLLCVAMAGSVIQWGLPQWGFTDSLPADSPSATYAVLVGLIALVSAWVFVIEILILVALEAIIPTGSLPSPAQLIESLPAQRRRGQRYMAIMAILAKHGLASYLRPSRRRSTSLQRVAIASREAMTEAGVTFVKLGQMLATRADVIPDAFVREFSQLHSAVPAEPWALIEPALNNELGQPWQEVFTHIDPEPLAAASVAQIHTAQLLDGTDVVLKLQRTKAQSQVLADLDIMTQLAQRLERSAEWARALKVTALAHGFAESLLEELDYRVELANMQAVAAASDAVQVPQTYPKLCTQRLLVMEKMSGQPLSQAGELLTQCTAQDRTAMADDLLRAVLAQVMVSGTFHADLHPGNIVVLDSSRLGLLDFGSVGRLDQGARTSLGSLMVAVERGEAIGVTDALIDLLDRPRELDDRLLEREVGQLVVRYGGGIGPGGSGALFGELTGLVVRHGFSIPPQIAAAFRALAALEGSLRTLSPDLDLVASARAQGSAMMADRMTPEAVRDQLQQQLAALVPMLQRLPRRLNRITEQLEDGRFAISMRVFHHRDDRAFLTGIMQQIVVSVLAAALGLAGVLLVVSNNGTEVATGLGAHAVLGSILLLFAFVLGARVLVLVFRSQQQLPSYGSRPLGRE